MRYTKKQRHRIYVRALKKLQKERYLCWVLSSSENLANLNDFPEVLKCKPIKLHTDRLGGYWFPLNAGGMKKRAAILRKAIKATE